MGLGASPASPVRPFSADSWDEADPLQPTPAAASPTWARRYRKPPKAGTDPDKYGGDDDEFLSAAQTYERNQMGAYERPQVAKRIKGPPPKEYHASLDAMLNAPPPALGIVPATEALQGRDKQMRSWAAQEYAAHRPVHDSNVRGHPRPLARAPRRAPGRRQACQYSECHLMHDAAHLDRFTHPCPHGVLCRRRNDVLHCERFRHPEVEGEVGVHEATGWAAERERSISCEPTIAASKLSQSLPALSCIPRGGFRPTGGTKSMTEFDSLRLRTDDHVTLIVHGINETWQDEDFYTFVRNLCPFPLVSVTVVASPNSHWLNLGKGFVTCCDYAEAEKCWKTLNLRNIAPNRFLSVEYAAPITKDHRDTFEGMPHQQTFGIRDNGKGGKHDPAVLRYNKLIGRCGAYWKDAEAIVDRMRTEGHAPNLYTYIKLLFCYRDGRPPQPHKAAQVIERMRLDNVAPTTTALNLVVDTWCRAGNMQRAEALVAKMESGIRMQSKWQADEEDGADQMPVPSEETYEILVDGWQRMGVAEDVGRRQRGFKMDEPPPVSRTHRREPVTGAVFGYDKPAASLVASWARRRAGFARNHMGYFQQQHNEANFGLLEPNKWRPRV